MGGRNFLFFCEWKILMVSWWWKQRIQRSVLCERKRRRGEESLRVTIHGATRRKEKFSTVGHFCRILKCWFNCACWEWNGRLAPFAAVYVFFPTLKRQPLVSSFESSQQQKKKIVGDNITIRCTHRKRKRVSIDDGTHLSNAFPHIRTRAKLWSMK